MPAFFRCHVVTDDPEVRHSLEQLLLSAGFTSLLNDSGFAVLDAAAGLSPGCMTVNVWMPGMDRFELLANLSDLEIGAEGFGPCRARTKVSVPADRRWLLAGAVGVITGRPVMACRNADLSRSQQPIVVHVAFLEHLGDRAWRVLRGRHLEDRLVAVGIERFA